ncbi:Shikimate kinase [Bacteroidales bacterium Barb4]|nr:Shikimate kinase [Bacteroidales bacterium Barb4]
MPESFEHVPKTSACLWHKKHSVKFRKRFGKNKRKKEKTYICAHKRTRMKRIFLIGYMAAGKTTIGRILAKQTSLSFIDLDRYVEGRYHKTIGMIFEEKGEEGFRRLEQAMLHEVGMFENVLISTGGGTPCHFDNMDFMNEAGTTVYLKVSAEELANRLEMSKTLRPVLQGRSGAELKAFVIESLAAREAFYNRAAHVFDAEEITTAKDLIVERLLV